MADDKTKKKPAKKEKKSHPFRNGLIIGVISGAFLGLLVDTPGFMFPIKEPIAGIFGKAKKEALKSTAAGLDVVSETAKEGSNKARKEASKDEEAEAPEQP